MTRGTSPRPLDPADEVHLDARLVPVAGGEDDAVALAYTCRSGPIVASSSAFMRIDVLAVRKASSTTCARTRPIR